MEINPQKPIMVTGATGYVAGWIVKDLLEKGHTVHAPIRNPNNKEKTKKTEQASKTTLTRPRSPLKTAFFILHSSLTKNRASSSKKQPEAFKNPPKSLNLNNHAKGLGTD